MAALLSALPVQAEYKWIGDPPGWHRHQQIDYGASPRFVYPPPERKSEQQDPDNTPELKEAWNLWHKRVAEAVYVRFDGVADRAFSFPQPLACAVTYTVTREKQITDIRLTRKSNNAVFDSVVMMALKSMNGSPLLEFPAGSKRLSVEKTATFNKNSIICDPPSFKYDSTMPGEDRMIRDILEAKSKGKNAEQDPADGNREPISEE